MPDTRHAAVGNQRDAHENRPDTHNNLRVWAPAAQRVTLHLFDNSPQAVELGSEPLLPSSNGWWESRAPLPPGTRYRLAVDDNPPFPDPRSRRQPLGVHGPSEIVDVSSFAFTDESWRGIDALGAAFYELHVGTFTPEGTLQAAAAHLPYLRDLGIDMVELMPVAPVPGTRNWGYDGVSIFAVTENYGGPESLAAFVDAAHAVGIGVCLDVVYNHMGPDGNYVNFFGPYFTDHHSTPWGQGVNVDGADCAEVRRFFVDNALQWVRDYHVDALRLDAVAFILDDSPRHILAEISDSVAAFAAESGRTISLIAESDINDPLMITPTAAGGRGMDAQWNDDVHHAIHAYLTGESFAYYGDFTLPGALEKAFRHAFVHDGIYSTFRRQVWGKPVSDDIDGHRFVICTEDHDQIGNRAIGDRPSSHLDFGQQAVANALALTSPFTPMLFMGQEWGTTTPFQFFTDYDDELGRAVDAGRHAEFAGWDWLAVYGEREVTVPSPQDLSTFTASKLDWSERDRPEHAAYWQFTRSLLALRKELPDLASGDRTETEIVRLGRNGYLRRGGCYVAFSCDGDATVTVPRADLVPLLSWGSPTIHGDRVDFTQAGVVVMAPAGNSVE